MAKTFFANGQRYDIEDADIPRFRQSAADAGFDIEEGQRYRTDDGHIYNLPKSKAAGFQQAQPSATRVVLIKRDESADEEYMTMPEVAKYLRSPEYRARHKGDAPEQHSVAWAGVKGALSGAVEGAWQGAEAAANKTMMAIPEVIGGVTQAVGNAVGSDWLVNSGRNFSQGVKGYLEKVGFNMSENVDERIGYEDALTTIANKATDMSKTAVKFAPAMVPGMGTTYANIVFGSDAINAGTDMHDLAIQNGFNEAEACTAGTAAGLINYFGAKYLTKAGGAGEVFKNPLLKWLGGAAGVGSTMGTQGALNAGVGSMVNRESIEQGIKNMADAFVEGEAEGVFFHAYTGAQGLAAGMRGSIEAHKQAKANKEFVRESILTAAESKDGAALLNLLMDGEGLRAAEQAVREGKPISRSVAKKAGLPDNMSAEERTKVITSIIDAKREVSGEQERLKERWENDVDPLKAESDAMKAQRAAETQAAVDAENARVAAEQEKTRKGQMERKARKYEEQEWERQEQERIARENAEQEQAPNVNEELRNSYHEWLRKGGRKNSDKNFNKWVKQNDVHLANEDEAKFIRGFDPEVQRENIAKARETQQKVIEDFHPDVARAREQEEREAWERQRDAEEMAQGAEKVAAREGYAAHIQEQNNAYHEWLEANGLKDSQRSYSRWSKETKNEGRYTEEEVGDIRWGEPKDTRDPNELTREQLRSQLVREQKQAQKHKDAEDEMLEQHRIESEKREESGVKTVAEEWRDSFQSWLKKNGKKNTNKNFRKWAAQHGVPDIARTADNEKFIRGGVEDAPKENIAKAKPVGTTKVETQTPKIEAEAKAESKPVEEVPPEKAKITITEKGKPQVEASKTKPAKAAASEQTVVERMTNTTPVEEVDISTVESGDSRIPNFKANANPKTGEVEPLKGEPLDLVSNPIVVFEFKDGHRSVVTGRHRFQLYKRSGKKTIPARIIKEADGWTVKDAQAIDAIANIIDEKGTTHDYVRFFENTKPTRDEATEAGLLARGKGRDAFSIFEGASQDTRSAIDWDGTGEKGLITPAQASVIASVAPKGANPKNEAIQRLLLKKAQEGVSGKRFEILAKTIAAEAQKSSGQAETGTQLDLFASEEGIAAMQHIERQAEYRAKKAAEYNRIAGVLRTAMQKGGKLDLNAEYAKELGITDVSNKAQLEAARDKAIEKADYWGNTIQLEAGDKAAMDADIQAALDAKAAKKVNKGKKLKAKRPTATDASTPAKDAPKQGSEGLTLEAETQKELNAERREARQKEEIAKKAEATLKGGAGEVGQPQMDLGDGETGDLFNPVVKLKAINPDGSVEGRVDLRRLDPKRRSDPKVIAWAKRHGRTVSDGKVTPDAVREYDAQMAQGAAKAAKRWFPDMNITYHDYGENIKRGQHDIALRDTSGNVLGWFEPMTKNVHLLPGADAATVAHEIMWHGTRDWAVREAAAGNVGAQKLLAKMKEVERSAPEDLKDTVRRIYRKSYGGDVDLLHNEFGAWFTMGKGGAAIEAAMAKAENRTWYAKAFNAVKEMFKTFLANHGKNRIDLSKVDEMSRDEFVDFLSDAFAKGKTLGMAHEEAAKKISTKETFMQKARRKIYDVNAALRDMQRDIEKKTGTKLSDEQNAEMANALTPGLREAAVMNVRGKLNAYKELLHKTGISDADAQYYMSLKAAAGRDAKVDARNIQKLYKKAEADVRAEWGEERIKGDPDGFAAEVEARKAIYEADYTSTNGSHIDPREARRMLDELEHGEHAEGYEEIRKYLRGIMDETLNEQVKAGLISKVTAEEYRLAEPDYIPFKNEFDETSGEFHGRGINLGRPEHFRARGRQSSAGDITTHIFGDYQSTLLRGIETNVRQKLANLVKAHPELGTIEHVTDTMKMREKTMSDRKDPGNISGDPNVVLYKKGGNTYAIHLNGERGAAIAAAMTERNAMKWNGWFPKFARASAALATRWSPTFSLRNFTKDNIELSNIVFSEKGAKNGAKWVGHYVKSQAKMAPTLAKYITTGKIDATTEEGKILKQYIDNGGLISGGATEGYDAIKQSLTPEAIAKEISKGKSKTRVVANHTLHTIAYLNEFAEMTTRVNAFAAEMKMGASAKQAALFARRATVDFNRHGEITGVTNIVRLFSNSTLGASARAVSALAKSKVGLGMAGALFANGFAQGLIEYYMNGEEDKKRAKTGEATGKDVSEFDRKTSLFYIRKGDNLYKVAQHEGPFSLIGYAGNCMARMITGQMSLDDAAKNLGVSTSELAYHFTGMGDINLQSREGNIASDIKAALVSGATPSALQPIVEMLIGIDYKGDPMYKRDYNSATPNSQVAKAHTPEYAKETAAWLNEKTGGNEARKGYVDIHPEAVQKFVEGFGKNAARDVMNAWEVGNAIANGEFKGIDARSIPVKRDFVRPLDGNTARYYEAYNQFKADKNEFTKRKDWTTEERREFVKTHPWVKTKGVPQIDKLVDKKTTKNPRSAVMDMGVNQLRKLCDGYVLTKSGKYIKPQKAVTDAEKERAKKEMLRKQSLILRTMGK